MSNALTPADPLSLVGSINFSFSNPDWEHTTYALAVRPTPGQPGNFDVFFNIGSEYNGVVIGGDGQVVLDQSGNPTYQPTVDSVKASGLMSATLLGDSIYMVTVHDVRGTPQLTNLTRIASGLRNAASMAIDPTTGDLWFADNGIDGNDGGNEAWSTDELDRIPAKQIGGSVEYFGFPTLIKGQLVYSYVKTIDAPGDPVTVVNPNVGIQPVVAFEPLPDPVLTEEGSESEGSSGFALAPPQFPTGLNQGVFVGFHGLFDEGGIANDENPMVFANPATGHYFDFVSNNLSNIGHLDEMLSTSNSLFVADISSTGELFGPSGVGAGVIYQIESIVSPKKVNSIETPSSTVSTTQDPPHGITVPIGTHSLTASAAQVQQGVGDLNWISSKAAAPAVTSTVPRRVNNLVRHRIDAARPPRNRGGEKKRQNRPDWCVTLQPGTVGHYPGVQRPGSQRRRDRRRADRGRSANTSLTRM